MESIHQTQPVLTYGSSLEDAEAAVILLHGRGASAQDILQLAAELPQEKVAYLAPQAAGHSWWPYSGFAPLESNEPYISSALATVDALVAHVTEQGIPPEKIALGGFSQGACLAVEYAARHARRYGGLLILSGALIGPLEMERDYAGSLAGTPVFLGAVDEDPWVAAPHIRLSAEVLGKLDGTVDLQLVPGRDHTIRRAEIDRVYAIVEGMTGD